MSLTLTLSRDGGEVSGAGTDIVLNDTATGYHIQYLKMYGETSQQTYSGFQLIQKDGYATPFTDTDFWGSVSNVTSTSLGNGFARFTSTSSTSSHNIFVKYAGFKWEVSTTYTVIMEIKNAPASGNGGITISQTQNSTDPFASTSEGGQASYTFAGVDTTYVFTGVTKSSVTTQGVRAFLSSGFGSGNTVDLRLTVVKGDHSADWQNYVGDNWQPFVGGVASPNPDYPQVVQTVTGRQVVTVTDGGSESQEYEINLGKNLNGGYPSDYSSSSGGISYVNNADGTISVAAGTTTSNSNSVNSGAASSQGRLLRLSAGTYTVSGSTSNIRIGVADSAGTQLATSTNGIPDTFTINTETLAFIRAQIPNGTTVSAATLYPQLEKGSATDYAPYFTPIELCKIGDYQDYIYKSGDNWYIHNEISKVVLDGSSEGTWTYLSDTGHERFVVNYSDIALQSPYAADTPKIQYCQYFEGSNGYHTYTGDLDNIISGHHNNHQIVIRATKYTSLSAFTTWLSTAKPSVYYALATPTDTQITNADLIAQLDALSSAQTYDGITIISVTSQNLASSLEVTAEAPIRKTYTEVEIGSPFTIADVEGKSSNTTLDGNVYVDWAYNKKQYSFNLFNLTPQDYADIRAYYDYQFSSGEFPTITVPELDINKLPVYMEISSRNIINQCLLTDKLTIKFRETVQP